MIQTMSTYDIQVRGAVAEGPLNLKSPLQIMVVRTDPDATVFTVFTDQSGLIGLIRYLHGQGFVLLSMHRVIDKSILSKENLTHD
jgi:hypothetical protein